MASGSDWLTNLFLYTFVFGLVFTVVSLLLGTVHIGGAGHGHFSLGHWHIGHIGHAGHAGHIGHVGDVGHVGHVGDVGHGPAHAGGSHTTLADKTDLHLGGHAPSNGDTGVDALSVLNMPTIMAFVTWFGGAGYIFSRALPFGDFVLVGMALASGLFGGAIMFVVLSRLLWPMMSKPLSRTDFSLPGTPARVVSAIREGGTGEIVYTKRGTRFTAGARTANGAAVERGTEVVILNYEHGIAYIQPVRDFLEANAQEAN